MDKEKVVAFYITSVTAIALSRLVSPTNLAGPGLDMLVFPAAFIAGLIIMIKGVTKKQNVLLHVAGFCAIMIFLAVFNCIH